MASNSSTGFSPFVLAHALEYPTSVQSSSLLAYRKIYPLHDACASGDLVKVQHLIGGPWKLGVNQKDNMGRTPIFNALDRFNLCVRTDFDAIIGIIRELLEAGASVDVEDENGHTPLHHLCDGVSTDQRVIFVYRILISAGSPMDHRCPKGLTPLQTAIDSILSLSIVISELRAATKKYPGDAPLTIRGRTVLHYFCEAGDLESVVWALEGGADPTVRNQLGETPLHTVIGQTDGPMRLDIIRCLVEAGASVNATCEKGLSPLHVACQRGQSRAVNLLLTHHRADVLLTTRRGFMPLHLSANQNDFLTVRMILSEGAPLDAVNRKGKTPLDLCPRSKSRSRLANRDTYRTYRLMAKEKETRAEKLRQMSLQQLCWTAAQVAGIDVTPLPPVVVRQNQQWLEKNRWFLIRQEDRARPSPRIRRRAEDWKK